MKKAMCLLLFIFLTVTLAGCTGGSWLVSPLPYNVSGKVVDEQGDGIPGVSILFSDGYGTALTGPDGSWAKSHLQGTVTVTPRKEGWSFRPGSDTVSPFPTTVTFVGEPADGNHPPQLDAIEDQSVSEGETLTFHVSATDQDGDTLSIWASELPPGADFDSASGRFEWTPAVGQSGLHTATFVVSDGSSTDSILVTISVTAGDQGPVVQDHSVSVDEDSSVIVDVLAGASEDGSDGITLVDITQPSGGVATITPDQQVEYTPNPDFCGDDSFTYTVSDGDGRTSTGTVDLTINPVNDVPVAQDDYFLVSASLEGGTISYLMGLLSNDIDVDGDSLSVVAVGQPEHGEVLQFWSEGNLEYSPETGFEGVDSFAYTVSDGNGGFAAATIRIQVYISD